MDDNEWVRKYFDRTAQKFDLIYSEKKNLLLKFLDQYLRRDMNERFVLTFEHCGKIKDKIILDVGCGSGRYAIEFALRGANKVVGVDFAESMISLADKNAKEAEVHNVCHFINADFLAYRFDDLYDISVAMGVFDYVSDPKPILTKLKDITSAKIIVSFPSRSIIRTPIRKIRYRFKNCPVYFYDRENIEDIIRDSGFRDYQIIKIKGSGLDYFVVANCAI